MATYLERYLSGEYEAVWDELTALGDAVRQEPLYTDALSVARETMRRVRHNIGLLIPRLEGVGYRFGYDELPVDPDFAARQPPMFEPPRQDVRATLARFESTIGVLPLSLYAWYEQIGTVNFVGKAPDSWTPTGFKTELYKQFVGPLVPGTPEDVYTFYDDHPEKIYYPEAFLDPLQADPLAEQFDLYADWQLEHAAALDGDEAMDDEEDEEDGETFKLMISLDHDLKVDTSGLGAYEMVIPNLACDGLLLNEWHQTTFVRYLRIALRWAGFPGLAFFRNPPQELPSLTQGLLEF